MDYLDQFPEINSGFGWIGVDLDGTLAHYDGWRGPTHIGAPTPFLKTVKELLDAGHEVRIFTARVSGPPGDVRDRIIAAIQAYTTQHLGVALPVTCIKDYDCIRLYDDRAVQVEHNTGVVVTKF